ncbi:MAG TPA: SpoIIE family protein phosphatase [Solirubrobacteraceae bacterium]|nr:SpoIIE family protein phosphatase [Solirubrobacteraceae bacterium]
MTVAGGSRADPPAAPDPAGTEASVERGARAAALLVESGAVLAGALDFAITLSQVARLTVPDLADLCVIDLQDQEGGISELAVAAAQPGLAEGLEALRKRHPLDPEGAHPVARVIRSGESELLAAMSEQQLRSFAQASEHSRFMVDSGYRSAVVAPLTARGRTLGALSTIRLADSEPYDEQDRELVCELARRAALALDNAQLFSDAQAMERRLEAVLENLAEAITVVEETGHTVFANQAALELLGIDSHEHLLQARPGEIMKRFVVLDESGRELDFEAMPARRLFRGEPAPPLLVRNIVRETGEERWLIVRASPIAGPASGRMEYVVNVFENVTEVKRAQLAEAFMAQASRVLSSSLDYAETLRRVARLAANQLADWCALDVLDERGELERVAVHHNDPGKLALAELLGRSYRPTLVDAMGVSDVIRTGEARIFNDVSDEDLETYASDAEHLRLLREVGARDVIIVPLLAPARMLGALTLVSSHGGRRLTEADLGVAVRLGRRAGTAVESARLYTVRSRIARVLQRALLPDSLPELPGFQIAASYRPAGELNEVGGDFYDVFPCGGDEWMLVIGDVCGKGAEAASVTALARHTLRTAAMLDARPAAMLELLHRTLRQQEPEGEMCTVCLVRVRAGGARAELTIALAGHPRPLLVGPGEQALALGRPGTLLGMVDPISVEETAHQLGPGQTLLLFTDGVAEASRAQPGLSVERLGARLHDVALQDMLEQIETVAVQCAGGQPHDDIALLGLRLSRIAAVSLESNEL